MLDVYIDDVKIAKVMTTSGVQRIYIAYGGSLLIKITKTVIVKEDFIDDKHLLIFIGGHLGKKIDILLARGCRYETKYCINCRFARNLQPDKDGEVPLSDILNEYNAFVTKQT